MLPRRKQKTNIKKNIKIGSEREEMRSDELLNEIIVEECDSKLTEITWEGVCRLDFARWMLSIQKNRDSNNDALICA